MGQTWRRRNRKLFTAALPTNGVNGYFFDGVAIGMGRVFSKAVAIVAIAVRARSYCAESLFDLEVAPVAINFFAGDALLGCSRRCVSAHRASVCWIARPVARACKMDDLVAFQMRGAAKPRVFLLSLKCSKSP